MESKLGRAAGYTAASRIVRCNTLKWISIAIEITSISDINSQLCCYGSTAGWVGDIKKMVTDIEQAAGIGVGVNVQILSDIGFGKCQCRVSACCGDIQICTVSDVDCAMNDLSDIDRSCRTDIQCSRTAYGSDGTGAVDVDCCDTVINQTALRRPPRYDARRNSCPTQMWRCCPLTCPPTRSLTRGTSP